MFYLDFLIYSCNINAKHNFKIFTQNLNFISIDVYLKLHYKFIVKYPNSFYQEHDKINNTFYLDIIILILTLLKFLILNLLLLIYY